MINIIYVAVAAVFLYMSYDIGIKLNLKKYILASDGEYNKIENKKEVCKAFSKIPLVAAIVTFAGILINSFVGILSVILTSTMLLVLIFIWFNSIKSVRNLIS